MRSEEGWLLFHIKLLKSVQNILKIFVTYLIDVVKHNFLLYKLEHYGIKRVTLSLFESYLTGKMQIVNCGGNASSPYYIRCRVPRGSLLGLVPFTLYLSDILFHFGVGYFLPILQIIPL